MELWNIALRIAGRWLAWLFSGLICGALCGAVIGACFGAVYWFAFLFRVLNTPNDTLGECSTTGALCGAILGAFISVLSFGLRGLTCVWKAQSRTTREIWRSCRAAWWMGVTGAVSFAIAGFLLCISPAQPLLSGLVPNTQTTYLQWSLIGFFAGILLGGLAPSFCEKIRCTFEQAVTPPGS